MLTYRFYMLVTYRRQDSMTHFLNGPLSQITSHHLFSSLSHIWLK